MYSASAARAAVKAYEIQQQELIKQRIEEVVSSISDQIKANAEKGINRIIIRDRHSLFKYQEVEEAVKLRCVEAGYSVTQNNANAMIIISWAE